MDIKKTGLIFGAIIAVVVSGMFLSYIVSKPLVEQNLMVEQRETVLVTGDANPGDNSGFFYFMIYPHQATPGTAYASNLSNATAYEYSDTGNTTATRETPYSTTFDIIIKVGITNEDGYYTANQTRNPNYNWCLLTCTDLSISADTNMTEVFIGNTTTYAWYQYYMNNGGSGYTISEGQSFNITSVKYYVQRIV